MTDGGVGGDLLDANFLFVLFLVALFSTLLLDTVLGHIHKKLEVFILWF